MSSSAAVLKQEVRITEQEVRGELAGAFRLAAQFGWSEIVWNHITARVPDEPEHFLINPLGVRWDEITASMLVKVDIDGKVIDGEGLVPKAGFVIHSAVHDARPDVHASMHIHSNDGIAVSALTEGLQPVCMEAMFFHENVGYHGFEGVSLDVDERERIAASLGNNKALILRNHGLLTTGANIGEAFTLMYYLQRACEIQMKVMASNAAWQPIPPEVCETYSRQEKEPRDATEAFRPGLYEWPALLRLLDDTDPSYKD